MSDTPVSITPAHHSESAEIALLLRISIESLCHRDHHNDPAIVATWIENKTAENVALWLENGDGFCAKQYNDRIVGFALLSRQKEILLNYVLPDFQYTGVGSQLLHAMEKSTGKGNLIHVQSTRTALPFYQRNGFRFDEENKLLLTKILR